MSQTLTFLLFCSHRSQYFYKQILLRKWPTSAQNAITYTIIVNTYVHNIISFFTLRFILSLSLKISTTKKGAGWITLKKYYIYNKSKWLLSCDIYRYFVNKSLHEFMILNVKPEILKWINGVSKLLNAG